MMSKEAGETDIHEVGKEYPLGERGGRMKQTKIWTSPSSETELNQTGRQQRQQERQQAGVGAVLIVEPRVYTS